MNRIQLVDLQPRWNGCHSPTPIQTYLKWVMYFTYTVNEFQINVMLIKFEIRFINMSESLFWFVIGLLKISSWNEFQVEFKLKWTNRFHFFPTRHELWICLWSIPKIKQREISTKWQMYRIEIWMWRTGNNGPPRATEIDCQEKPFYWSSCGLLPRMPRRSKRIFNTSGFGVITSTTKLW